MTFKLTDIFKKEIERADVSTRIDGYQSQFKTVDGRKSDYSNLEITYYDLVTDFYEYGWGRSFHFAPRAAKESFPASLARHEHHMALRLGLGPGMNVLDLGCGIGGPQIEIARFSGAKIVGVNNNEMQLKRAKQYSKEAGLSHLTDWINCDFMQVDAPDQSFDAIYSIEASCCAPSKTGIYGETFRLLKPGGCLGVYEYCMTDVFDPNRPDHLKLKADMEFAGALPEISKQSVISSALEEVGFEAIKTQDLAADAPPGIPWYEPLAGSGLSLASLRSSSAGRQITHGSLWLLEKLRIVPAGTTQVSSVLNLAAMSFEKAGRLGIFTPMQFFHARKPSQ